MLERIGRTCERNPMTVWQIHYLNARNALTGVMPETRAAAREARVSGITPVNALRAFK